MTSRLVTFIIACLAFWYDVLGGNQVPQNPWFNNVDCIETNGTDTVATEAAVNPQPFLRFYLVRAQNFCPGLANGGLGTTSDGTPRIARVCGS